MAGRILVVRSGLSTSAMSPYMTQRLQTMRDQGYTIEETTIDCCPPEPTPAYIWMNEVKEIEWAKLEGQVHRRRIPRDGRKKSQVRCGRTR